MTAWGGSTIASAEILSGGRLAHNFSNSEDTLYTGSARGLVRGLYYPYNVLSNIPKVWDTEKHPWD